MTTQVTSAPVRTPAIPETSPAAAPRSITVTGILAMTGAAAVWTAAVGGLAVWRHNEFLSHRYDLGNMVQAVWSSAHGSPFEVTDGATGEQVTRLAGHVDPALALFVPFWWLHPHPETMIVLQAAALAAGIYPVVRLAMKYVGSPVAVGLIAAWYLAFPWIVWNAINDVHAVTLAIPLLLYAIWFLDEHRVGRFTIVAILAVLTGELIGLTVAALGVWYAIRSRRVRVGLVIALLGTAWTAICLFVLVPAFNSGEPSPFYDRFESVGGSPGGLVSTLFTDPMTIADAMTTHGDGAYLLRVLMPTVFLALGSPLLLIAALPQLAINLLTDWWPSTQPEFQYVAALVPVLVASTIMTLRRFSPLGRLALSAVLASASVLCLAIWPPLPGGHFYLFSEREPAERVAAMRAAVGLIPADAAVTTTNWLGAHLSDREVIHSFPRRSESDWIAIDTRDPILAIGGERRDTPAFTRFLRQLDAEPGWTRVFDREGVRVYRRAP